MEPMYLHYFTKSNTYPFYIHFAEHKTDFKLHTHVDFHELVIILNGSAMHVVDNEQFFIKKGDVFVISNKTSHGYIDTYDFKICNIMFRPELTFGHLQDIRKLAGFHALFVLEPYLSLEQRFTSRLSLSTADYLVVKGLLDAMITEYYHEDSGRMDMLSSLFTQLSIYLSRKYQFSELPSAHPIINISVSLSYMETHFNQPIAIEHLATLSNMSIRHFNRLFKDTYGTTPVHYLIHLRLEKASYLLQNTPKSITEIALLSGFQDINYFTRVFKKFRKMTPKAYRKKEEALME